MSTPFEAGSSDAPICLIGEAPSTNELVKGFPFAGPAGAVLEQCLHSAGIARSDCYILNVFEEEVFKKGDTSDTLYSRTGEKLWTTQKGFTGEGLHASRGCRSRLAACSSAVLVPMGGPALSLTTAKTGITKWRGSILRSDPSMIPFQRKCIPTLHPAASIHGSYTQRYLISADLKRAQEESSTPSIMLPKRELITDPTMMQIETAFLACWDAKEFATDIECSAGHVSCFSLSWTPESAISIPIIDEGYKPRWPAEVEARIWHLYADLLGAEEVTQVNQNIAFDLTVLLHRNKIIARGPLDDPMIAHSVMNPALPKGLDMLCSLYTKEPYYKQDNGLDANYFITDFPQHWKYNAMDAAIALECMWRLRERMAEEGYEETYSSTIATLPALIYMMVRGFKVNVPALRKTREMVSEKIRGIVARIGQEMDRPVITIAAKSVREKRALAEMRAININSPKQLSEYFYNELKLKPFTRGGSPSMDDKALAQIYRRDRVNSAKLLQDYRSLSKLRSTYLDVLLDEDDRLRCSYNARGTWTGRLNSSETVFGTGMNLQNLPDEFQAFLEADYG